MAEINEIVEQMTAEVYQKLKSAVEIGKWEDGSLLTAQQKESTLQLVMLYQATKLDQTDHLTINRHGEVNELSKRQLKNRFKGDSIATFKEEEV